MNSTRVTNPYEDKIPEFHGVGIDIRADDYGKYHESSTVGARIRVRGGQERNLTVDTPPIRTETGAAQLGAKLAVAISELAMDVGAEIFTALVGRAIAPLVNPHVFWGVLEKALYLAIGKVEERKSYEIRAAWWLLIERTIHPDTLEYIGHGIEHPAAGSKSADRPDAHEPRCCGC